MTSRSYEILVTGTSGPSAVLSYQHRGEMLSDSVVAMLQQWRGTNLGNAKSRAALKCQLGHKGFCNTHTHTHSLTYTLCQTVSVSVVLCSIVFTTTAIYRCYGVCCPV